MTASSGGTRPSGYLGTAGCIGRLSERDIAAISGILAQIDA